MAKETPYYTARLHDNSLSITRTPSTTAQVVAAGALIWRLDPQGEIELLIIHRPRYDDWSWPKGKQDPGESLPETALREIREEVSLDVRLGVPLAVTSYPVHGKSKDVFYWAAKAPENQVPAADEGEVDQLRWVSIDQARELLSNESDQLPLDALASHAAAGTLDTVPSLLVRHAHAHARESWSAADELRPLDELGERQAKALVPMLAAWAPTRIYSSPWVRCERTVKPLLKWLDKKGTPVTYKEKKSLSEAGAAEKPKRCAKAVRSLLDRPESTLLCGHRPVFPQMLEAVREYLLAPGQWDQLPIADPHLETADVLILQLSAGENPRVVSIETSRPTL